MLPGRSSAKSGFPLLEDRRRIGLRALRSRVQSKKMRSCDEWEEDLKTMIWAGAVLAVTAVAARAEDWVSFSMGEGPDLRLDRSTIRRDAAGEIAPWGKGWMVAKTERGAGSHASPGYFVTDCRDLYYVLRVNPQTKSVDDPDAQPLRVAPGAVADQIESIVCANAK